MQNVVIPKNEKLFKFVFDEKITPVDKKENEDVSVVGFKRWFVLAAMANLQTFRVIKRCLNTLYNLSFKRPWTSVHYRHTMMKSSATEAISLSSSANGAPERTEQSIRFEVPITNFETTTVIDWRLLLEQRIEEEEADDDDDDDDDDEDEDGEQGDDDNDDEDEDDDDEENDDGDDNGDDDNEPNGAAPPNDSKAVNARKWLRAHF
jgi:hypothetical protein